MMTQEDKKLLLIDLCCRLPYMVKVKINEKIEILNVIGDDGGYYFNFLNDNETGVTIENIKPYLFPFSSMTKEQTEEVHNLIYQGISESVDETKEWLKTRKENDLRPITLTYILNYKLVIDWLNKNHFDYRGLIEKGLAIDATGLNIY